MIAFFHQLLRIGYALFKLSLILLIPIVITFFVLLEHVSSQFDGNAELPVDCAVVFGAAVHQQTKAGPGIQRRVSTAANLYKRDQVQTLFMTGGRGDATHDTEAEVMKRTAVTYGVPEQDIITEDQARSTWENLALVKPKVLERGCESVIAISDGYHLARIQYIAKLQEWGNLRTLPAEQRPDRAFELRATVREVFGLVYYFFNQFFAMEMIVDPTAVPST